jgi:hypothetical protein
MTAFRKAEALACQRYDRDKLLSPVHEVTTHFRMPNRFERSKMRAVCRSLAEVFEVAPRAIQESQARSISYWSISCWSISYWSIGNGDDTHGKPVEPRLRSSISRVKERIDGAKLGKTGACHLFRHTMATLMHENGADIRFIQEMLGHARLETTQIYTQVSIRTLQQVHTATHPAATLEHHSALEAMPRIAPQTQPGDPAAEDLFATLDAEAVEVGDEEE